MKTRRQAAVLDIVQTQRIASQEELRAMLARRGLTVTQATLSRDIRQLGLVKVSDPEGGSSYRPAAHGATLSPTLAQLLPALAVSIEGVGNLVVIRTTPGSANTVGMALDRQRFAEVMGTIAGDDTILLVVRSDRARRAVIRHLRAGAGQD